MWHYRAYALICAVLFLHATPARAEWDKIDCSKSEVTIPGATMCEHGPSDNGASGTCRFERFAAFHAPIPNGPPFRFRVSAYINHTPNCWVRKLEENEDLTKLLKSATPYAGQGQNWSPIRNFLTGYVASFVADNRECIAFFQYGPAFKSGYSHTFWGDYCTTKGKHITDEELADAFKSIHISQ